MTDIDASCLPTRLLERAEGHVAYDDTGGTGPLILGLPGMGDLRSQYRHLRPALVAAGYRVVTMDVRGFGETSARWMDYSARAVGCDALALIDHLGGGPAVIMGNSFAAGSALWAAHDTLDRVKGVILFGPIVRDLKVPMAAKAALALGFAGPWRIWFWATYWDSLFPGRKPADHTEAKAALCKNLRETGRMAALMRMLDLPKADTAAMLPNVDVPALIVMGSKDADFPDPAREARQVAAVLKAEVALIESAGHYPHAEMPDEVERAVMPFLDNLRHDHDAPALA